MDQKHPAQYVSVYLIIILVTVALDQFTKWWALGLDYSLMITNFLFIQTTTNTGISFGLIKQMPWIPTVIAIVVILYLTVGYYKIPKEWPMQVACALIVAGAAGNLIDRVRIGAVVDFIALSFWPTFNLADSAIVIGGVLLVVAMMKIEKKGLHIHKH